MADEKATNGKEPDPMAAFREIRDVYLDAWAKATTEVVNTEAYAKATGATLDTYLSASAPFREVMEKTMLQALQQLNMPSRADFISLAERLVNVEMKLDDMDAKLDKLTALPRRTARVARAPKPVRTTRSKRKEKR